MTSPSEHDKCGSTFIDCRLLLTSKYSEQAQVFEEGWNRILKQKKEWILPYERISSQQTRQIL